MPEKKKPLVLSDEAACSSVVKFVRRYNRWRRGDERLKMPCPTKIGKALDDICALVDSHYTQAEIINGENIRLKNTLAKWIEWARMHGHLDHAAGIADDSRRMISSKND